MHHEPTGLMSCGGIWVPMPEKQLERGGHPDSSRILGSSMSEVTVHTMGEDKLRIDSCILMQSQRRKTSRRNYHGDKSGEKHPRDQWKIAENGDGKWPGKGAGEGG